MSAQVVVVTGASGGIGRAVARAFGARGATVALLARGEKGLAGAARDVRAGGGRRPGRSRSTSPTRRRWTPPPTGSRTSSARSTSG